ncbi:tyrosine-type recombinase/integrase [Hellea balneolensis]|uniref:tyrosine-type recombinase/integrase n=1 Tax=Hellea balneolensis TaxID=287478 RepID=UPI00040C38EC|nr:site-specific integrase [Hellea balneolensis]
MKLNKTNIDKIAASDKDQFHWDDDLKGFGLRVSAKGRKTFIVQYRHAGRTQRIRIGQHGRITAFDARKDAQILLGEIAQGQSPAKAAKAFRESPTLTYVAERFMREHVNVRLKPSTQSDYKRNIRAYILPALGSRRVADISHRDIHELHHKMRATPIQANRTVSALSKIFNLCEKWGYRDGSVNPCTQIERYKEKARSRFLDRTELERLWNALEAARDSGDISPYAVSAFKLLILTGCRLGEIRTMKWEYLKGNRVEFPDTKTGYKRVPLNKDAMAILSKISRKPDNDYVICGNVEGQPIINLQKSWRHIRKRAGLEDVRIHDLRHTFASHAVMGGTPLAIVSKLLGHSQITTTMRYAHLADAELLDATELIGNVLRVTKKNNFDNNNIHYLEASKP